MKLSIMQSFGPPVICILLGPDIFLSILLSYSVNLRSYVKTRSKISHLYKTKAKLYSGDSVFWNRDVRKFSFCDYLF